MTEPEPGCPCDPEHDHPLARCCHHCPANLRKNKKPLTDEEILAVVRRSDVLRNQWEPRNRKGN
jgi:hypothetical protein